MQVHEASSNATRAAGNLGGAVVEAMGIAKEKAKVQQHNHHVF
jgi:hypothetical protein